VYVLYRLHVRTYFVGSAGFPFVFMILLRNSSTVHEAPWDFIRCPQFLLTHKLLYVSHNRINQRMSLWRTGWPSMRTLTTDSTPSTEVLGDTSTEMRRTAVVLPALLVWPQGKVRTPKEVVARPVRNSGSSLMLHILHNKYSNSLVADKSVVSCSRKAMLQDAWNGMKRISRGPYMDVTAGGFPSHVKVASSQTCVFQSRCCSKDQRRTHTLSGWTAWVGGDLTGTKFATPALDGCV
jgi:hypothetical protein